MCKERFHLLFPSFLIWIPIKQLLIVLHHKVIIIIIIKAAGVDGIPVRFIKAHPASIGRLIARLVNHSITSGIFPDLWKYAVVTPIQKSKESMELTMIFIQSLYCQYFRKY